MNKAYQEQMQKEKAAAQKLALDALRSHFGGTSEYDLAAINRDMRKVTVCNAWVKVNENAEIVLGSIVDGGSTQLACDPIPTKERPQTKISASITDALRWLEQETAAASREANS